MAHMCLVWGVRRCPDGGGVGRDRGGGKSNRRRRHVLTVKFRQPSHEFTFNVDIDLISKLTILTLMISQVHFCMSILESIVYAGN
jgi:hypothetical protein